MLKFMIIDKNFMGDRQANYLKYFIPIYFVDFSIEMFNFNESKILFT